MAMKTEKKRSETRKRSRLVHHNQRGDALQHSLGKKDERRKLRKKKERGKKGGGTFLFPNQEGEDAGRGKVVWK